MHNFKVKAPQLESIVENEGEAILDIRATDVSSTLIAVPVSQITANITESHQLQSMENITESHQLQPMETITASQQLQSKSITVSQQLEIIAGTVSATQPRHHAIMTPIVKNKIQDYYRSSDAPSDEAKLPSFPVLSHSHLTTPITEDESTAAPPPYRHLDIMTPITETSAEHCPPSTVASSLRSNASLHIDLPDISRIAPDTQHTFHSVFSNNTFRVMDNLETPALDTFDEDENDEIDAMAWPDPRRILNWLKDSYPLAAAAQKELIMASEKSPYARSFDRLGNSTTAKSFSFQVGSLDLTVQKVPNML
jgi:hypothetical protein